MRIHSHSSLGSFESCPRQYWYQYIGKPPVERVDTIEAFLGKRVHETLETRNGGLSPHPALPRKGEREWDEPVSNVPAIVQLAPDRPSPQPGRPASRDRHIREHNRGVAGSK